MRDSKRAQALRELGHLRLRIRQLEANLELVGAGKPPEPAAQLSKQHVYQLVDEFGSDFISIHAANGDYLHASPTGQRLFGWSEDDLIGQNAYLFFHPDDIERIAADHSAHNHGTDQSIRYRLRCKSGEYRWVETRSRARLSERGVEQIVCITRDVHLAECARRSSEAAALVLAEHERAAIVGGVIAACSHEINNPLMAALLSLDNVKGQTSDVAALSEARHAVSRLGQVMRELAMIVRADWVPSGSIDLASAAEHVASLLPTSPGCEIITELEPVPVRGPEAFVLQCLYHIGYSHVRGSPGEQTNTTFYIRVQAAAEHAKFTMRSNCSKLPQTMRADLTGLALGEYPQISFPMSLAQQVAERLDGQIENRMTPDGLVTQLQLPRVANP